MAKRSMLERDRHRKKLIKQYQAKRLSLRDVIRHSNNFDEVMKARETLEKLPLDSSPVRLSSRCQQCGRPHAVYRKFGLCRICLRKALMFGHVAGGRKSSW